MVIYLEERLGHASSAQLYALQQEISGAAQDLMSILSITIISRSYGMNWITFILCLLVLVAIVLIH